MSANHDSLNSPVFEPEALWITAINIVTAHGGSVTATVRDLIDAKKLLRESTRPITGRMETATGEPAVHVHPNARTATDPD